MFVHREGAAGGESNWVALITLSQQRVTNFNRVPPVLWEVLEDLTCDAALLAQHKLKN